MLEKRAECTISEKKRVTEERYRLCQYRTRMRWACLTSAGVELLCETPHGQKPGGLLRAKGCQAMQYP
jgi:hypothetical protein